MAETPPAFDAIRTQAGRASPNSPCLGHAQSGLWLCTRSVGTVFAALPYFGTAPPPSENDGKYHFQPSKIVQAEGKIKRTMKPNIPQTVPAPAQDRRPRSTVSTLALSLHPENHGARKSKTEDDPETRTRWGRPKILPQQKTKNGEPHATASGPCRSSQTIP